MKMSDLILINLFEGLSRDELIKNLEKKRDKRYLDYVLDKMHELVKEYGDRQSIGGYAFDVSRFLGGAISGREIERLYREKYTNESILEWGRIVKGVNTTQDVGTDEIKKQAAKFGNTVDQDGRPPSMSQKTKGSKTNVRYNLGMVKEDAHPKYTAYEWALIEGGHTFEEPVIEPKKPKQPGDLFTQLENFADGKKPGRKEKSQTNEALDNPYPISWSEKGPDIYIANSQNDLEIFIADEEDNGVWDISFMRSKSMRATQEGNEFRIFATVKLAIIQWWKDIQNKKLPVNKIVFSASKDDSDGRSLLYKRFASMFAQKIGYRLEIRQEALGDDVNDVFVLSNPNVEENFADGKKPGRKGLAKRSGVNTKASVSSLRKTAKNSSGEKARMAHWLANMKSGQKKK